MEISPNILHFSFGVSGAICYQNIVTKFRSSLEEWEKPREEVVYILSLFHGSASFSLMIIIKLEIL